MADWMDHPLSRSALLFALILIMTAIGLAIARRFRDRSDSDGSDRQDLMTEFRDLHAKGGLSDEEYRTIKTKLAAELREELRAEFDDNGGTG
jgi:uncharacterized membrane protein